MLISLCGDNNEKDKILKQFKEEYKDTLIICNYFYIYFDTVIENENIKYKLLDEYKNAYDARIIFSRYIEKIVNNKINEYVNYDKDKIIIILTDNVLTPDINKTIYFEKSDIRVLVMNGDELSDSFYDKKMFDYVVDVKKEINVKKLVRL